MSPSWSVKRPIALQMAYALLPGCSQKASRAAVNSDSEPLPAFLDLLSIALSSCPIFTRLSLAVEGVALRAPSSSFRLHHVFSLSNAIVRLPSQ